MKGAISTLQMIVLGLIFLLVATFFIQQAGGRDLYSMGKEGKNLIGEPADITYKTETKPGETPTDYGDHIYPLNAWDPFRPSEIACLMADKIVDDFSILGTGDRPEEKCWHPTDDNGKISYCLIDKKLFKLAPGDNGELGWENTLTSRGCSLCKEPPFQSGGTVIPKLDEICLNANLNRTIGSSTRFCYKSFPVGEESVTFSNCRCGNGNSGVSGWDNHCDGYTGTILFTDCYAWDQCWLGCDNNGDDFCDNGVGGHPAYKNEMLKWYAEKYDPASGDTPYIVRGDTTYDNDPSSDTLGENLPYAYGIYWIPEEKNYRVKFARIPQLAKETNFDFLKNNINTINDNYLRYDLLGYNTPQTRRIIDRIVVLDNDKSLMALLQEVTNALSFNLFKGESTCGFLGGSLTVLTATTEKCVYLGSCKDVACIDGNNKNNNDAWAWYYGYDTIYGISKSLSSTFKFHDYNFTVDSSILAGETGKELVKGKTYRVAVNYWVHPHTWGVKPSENSGSIIVDMVDKSIGIYPIADDKINGCCDAGKMSFSISPGGVNPSQSVIPSVKDLSYCYNKNVYFYDASCINKKKSDLTEKTSCNINSQESFDDTMYCWAGEINKPRPVGCTGGSFTAPDANGDYTYYACIDTNGDEIFDKEVQTTLSVSSCPDKCEGGKEYKTGHDNPCVYDDIKDCKYNCYDTLRCNQGKLCTVDTTSCGCDTGIPCSDTCPSCSSCTSESNLPPYCWWSKADCVVFFCLPVCSRCLVPGIPPGCNCNGACGGLANECCVLSKSCQMNCVIDNVNCPTY
jgi:hypothetical protein